jgi:predicted ATPase
MLKRLYIDNFRCFVNFEYKPERKQLLLGANGSGKSSLLDVIRKLKEFVKGHEIPFTQADRTRWHDRPFQLFEIDAQLGDGTSEFSYRIEISYSSKSGAPFVALERLSMQGSLLFELKDGEMRSFSDGEAQNTFARGEATESSLHFVAFTNPHVRLFLDWLDSVQCIKIDAYESKMDEASDTAVKFPDYELEDLPDWYNYISATAEPGELVALRDSLRETFPGFQSLRFDVDTDGSKKFRIFFEAPGGKPLPYSLHELSDGQRCLIALFMILHFLIRKGHTVFIDEPDNFISLREIQPWLLEAEDAVQESNGQLILISHHPEILNQWAKEYGLLFTRDENGHVRTKRFSEVNDTGLEPAETIARGWEDE